MTFQTKMFEKFSTVKQYRNLKFISLKGEPNKDALKKQNIDYVLYTDYKYIDFDNHTDALLSLALTGIPINKGTQNILVQLRDPFTDMLLWELSLKNRVLLSDYKTAYKSIINYPAMKLRKKKTWLKIDYC